MKKNYFKILLSVLALGTSGELLKAQCTTPLPPPVSGTTLAACTNSASFTLTGSPTGTNIMGWYKDSFGGNAITTNTVFTTPTLTQTTTYYVGQTANPAPEEAFSLSPHTNNVAAMETRGFWFVAPADFVITSLRVPVAIGGTVSGLAVVKFPTTPPIYTNVTNTFTTLYLDQAITGTNAVIVHIPVYAGDIIGVLGERGSYSSYQALVNPYTSTLGIGTTTVNFNRLGMLYDLATTPPTDLWTESLANSIGRIEMSVRMGCNSTLTPVTVSIAPVPTVIVTPPPFVCANSPYTLTANGATSYTWSGGPQSSSYVVTPSANTTYSVMGSILGNCTSTLSSVTISVQTAVPSLTASASSTMVCSGDPVTLTGTGANSVTWTASSGTVANAMSFIPSASEVYTLTSANSCGVGTKTISVLVNPTPTITTAASPTSICDGQSATLTASGAITFIWNNTTVPGATFVVSPNQSSFFNVTGLSNVGCPGYGSQGVVVYPNPTLNILSNKSIVCAAGPATLSALTSIGADTYSWTTGALTPVTVVNPTTTSIYTVVGTNTTTGCTSTKTFSMNVFLPTLYVTNSATVCYGAAVTLTANAAGSQASYSWTNGPSLPTNNITATVAAIYTVSALTSTPGASNCKSTGTVGIAISPNPTISVSATSTMICKGEKLLLTANGGTFYAWTGLSPVTKTIQVAPNVVNSITIYTVTGADDLGCASTATYAVKVNACTSIAEFENNETAVSIYPNPSNGNFVIQVKSQMQLSLVNELGQVVRELSFNSENNYKQNITELSNGIYFMKGLSGGSAIQNKIVVNK